MQRIILFILLLLTNSIAIAGGSVTWNNITGISFQNGDLMVYSEGWQNPNNCQQSNAIILKHTDSNFDKAYSLILAAYMSGKQMTAWSDDCHTFDGKTYNHIRGFKYLHIK